MSDLIGCEEALIYDPELDTPEVVDKYNEPLNLYAASKLLKGTSLPATVLDALSFASKEVGVREVPSNRGKRVQEYQNATTLDGTGWPWCAAYVAWCIREAAKKQGKNPNDFWLPSASCDFVLYWARKHEILSQSPQRGDAFLVMATEYDATHIGFVKEVHSSTFTTYEGNTNNNGSAEGVGVFSLPRPRSSRYRYVRWGNLITASQVWKVFSGSKMIGTAIVDKGVSRMSARTWAKAMGFRIGWQPTTQTVSFNGRTVPHAVSSINGVSYLPVRKLAEFSGLKISQSASERKIIISR